MVQCRNCKAEIIWVETAAGKKMPLDAKPVKMALVKEGIAEIIDVYRPHWATCPGAAEFRRESR